MPPRVSGVQARVSPSGEASSVRNWAHWGTDFVNPAQHRRGACGRGRLRAAMSR